MYCKFQDIEIAGFFASTFAWGLRSTIIKKAKHLMQLMDNSPYDFVLNASQNELNLLNTFSHRTFNGIDCLNYVLNLRNLYTHFQSMDNLMKKCLMEKENIKEAFALFRLTFFLKDTPHRTYKHFADAMSNAACKRFWLFLRWMVRKDEFGVDFGIWDSIKPSQLLCPLDVHVGNTARRIGLILRTQNDWTTVEELTTVLRLFDYDDPVKYDYALFGLGLESKKHNQFIDKFIE